MVGSEVVAVWVEAEVLSVDVGVCSGVVHINGVSLPAQVVIGDIASGVCGGASAGD